MKSAAHFFDPATRRRSCRTSRAPSRSSWTATAAGRAARGLDVAEGHRAGSRALRPVVETAIDLGVQSLAVYAFSTENWTRLGGGGRRADGHLRRDDRPRARRPRRSRACARGSSAAATARRSGCRRRWPTSRTATADKTTLNLWIAFDYGGRAELVEAARRIVEGGVEADDVDESPVRPLPLRAGHARSRSRSSAPPASCASRTSCSGSPRTPSSSSSTRSGPTSGRTSFAARWRITPSRRRRFGGR